MSSRSALAKRILLPDKGSINTGLHSPHNGYMRAVLRLPESQRTQDLIVTMNVGPFELTGLKPFLQVLKKMFSKVEKENHDLWLYIRNAGCYNRRKQRGSNTLISNHSWGVAVDLYFGEEVTPRGSGQTEQGLLALYPYMHNAQIYWGAEYDTDDAMHWEASTELLEKWRVAGTI